MIRLLGFDKTLNEEVATRKEAIQRVKSYLSAWMQDGDRIAYLSRRDRIVYLSPRSDDEVIAMVINDVGEATDASVLILLNGEKNELV